MGKLWQPHLRAHRPPVEVGYASFYQRHGGRDHFTAHGRTWHRWKTTSACAARAAAEKAGPNVPTRDAPAYCPWQMHERGSGPAHLRVEVQDPFQRLIATSRLHPVPYPSHLARAHGAPRAGAMAPRATLVGMAMSSSSDEAHAKDGEVPARRMLVKWCHQRGEPDCVAADDWLRVNRQSVFCAEPPGVSAGRKGMVDALLSGCIPLTIATPSHSLSSRGVLYPWSQDDIWPWHWPAQRAASVSVSADEIREHGLDRLRLIDEEQIALMQRMLALGAPMLVYPFSGASPAEAAIMEAEAASRPPRSKPPSPPEGVPRIPNALEVALHHLAVLAQLKPCALSRARGKPP